MTSFLSRLFPVLSISLAANVSILSALPAAATALTSQRVVEIVQKSQALAQNARISAAVGGDEVSLSSFRNKSDNQKDLKIEAVMCAKALMEADSGIRRVTMRFYEPLQPKKYAQITVTAAEIKTFGSGSVTPDEFLARLNFAEGNTDAAPPATATNNSITTGVTEAQPGGSKDSTREETPPGMLVVEGPKKPERQALYARIKMLEAQGVGTANFINAFHQLENLASADQVPQLDMSIQSLTRSIAQQESALDQRNKQRAAQSSATSGNLASPAPTATGPGGGPHSGPRSPTSIVAAPPEAVSGLSLMARSRYGWFTPSPDGLLASDRFMIAERLYVLKIRGYPVEKYAGLFREMEESAALGQQARAEQSLKNFWWYIKPDPPYIPK
ncbi:MAG: hypothetical protein U0105_08665 [Candidatus Obscuribacterales bacterium]